MPQITEDGGYLDGTPQMKVFVHNDVAYFRKAGIIHSVMCTRPEGFAVYDFSQAVPFERSDVDDDFLADLIEISTKEAS